MIVYLSVCSMEEEEEGDCDMCTDSDDKTDATNCKVKWTQEEVSEKNNLIFYMYFSDIHLVL